MEIANKPLMVPWDFTEIAEYALEYAIKIAKIDQSPVHLVHIAKKKNEIKNLKGMLEKYAEEVNQKYNIKPGVIVREGTIFSTIGDVADEIDAGMVVMGTHGIKGMQKLTGSWALKVIVSSKVPFVVVQAPPGDTNFEHIVFPVDFRREDKEKISGIIFLHKYFDSKIHIIKPKKTDKRLLRGVNNNITFARKMLNQKGVHYDIVEAPGKKSFAKETIDYAKEVNASLILTMSTKNIGFTDYVFGAVEQFIIANSAKIPVMCLNPRKGLVSGGFAAMGG